MKISLADVEAILESIKETKRLLKPLAATKDELLEGVQRNDRDLDDDRIELLNPAIVKQIGNGKIDISDIKTALEKLNFKAESTAARISAEPGDVAVEAKFLSKALAARGVTEYKIGKVCRSLNFSPRILLKIMSILKLNAKFIENNIEKQVICLRSLESN